MNLAEFQTALPALLASETEKPAVVEALKAAGFVPAAELAALQADLETKTADARSEGEAAGIATACEIAGLCGLAGASHMIESLLAPGATVDGAKKKLMDARSQVADGQQQIFSRTSPTGSGERNLLVEGAQARVEASK